jgi:hypothetical protein
MPLNQHWPSASLNGAFLGLALALIVTGVNFWETFALVGTYFVGIVNVPAIPTTLRGYHQTDLYAVGH